MKMQQLEYIIAIAHAGSITAAAKNLYQAQPNISISLKELEAEIGMQIFWRTPNGMVLTPEGENFLSRAKDIVESMHSLEADYTNRGDDGISIKISSVRSAYIPDILSEWVNEIDSDERLSMRFYETNTNKVIEDVNSGKADIGVIRISSDQLETYTEQLKNRKLQVRPLDAFIMQPIMSVNHPLANSEDVTLADLEKYPEIVHADDEMNIFERNYIKNDYESNGAKRIYVQDNGSKMLMLQGIKNAYMWASPAPRTSAQEVIKVVNCSQANIKVIDMVICKKSSESSRTIKACMDYLTEKCRELPGVLPVEEQILP